MNTKALHKLTDKLACPECKKPLLGRLTCSDCKKSWQQRDGVYLFLDKANIVAQAELKGITELDKNISISRNKFNKLLVALPELPKDLQGIKGEGYFTSIASGKKTFRRVLGEIGTGKIVLEIGADWGWASYNIAKAGNLVIATDINATHLSNSKIFTTHGVDFLKVQSDMGRLPITSGSIDVVFATASVHHSCDLVETFREFARVLAPDGKLIMLREPVSGRFSNQNNFGVEEKNVGINETAPTLDEWSKALSTAGFKARPQIAFLNFLAVKSPKNWLRTIKRSVLQIPIIGSIFAQFTITDYNFWAVKK